MGDFALDSVDWRTVALLHGDHLSAETAYLEEMVRWGIHHGRPWGVVRLDADDLLVSGGSDEYEVLLRRCAAITPGGYVVDVSEKRQVEPLRGHNDRHRGERTVPIFIGVPLGKDPIGTAPAQSAALLGCGALRRRYRLSCEVASTDFDWLQIGQMRQEGTRFAHDDRFIPVCVSLGSHPALCRAASEIGQTAANCLAALERMAREPSHRAEGTLAWRAMIGLFIQALASAAVTVDQSVHPRQYVERLTISLRAQLGLINLGEAGNSNWVKANGLMREAVDYVTEHAEEPPASYWTEALARIREALEAFAVLVEGLSPVTEVPAVDTAQPPVVIRRGGYQPIRQK